MSCSPWQLDRRTVLRGLGFSLTLPWLEAMAVAGQPRQPPRRFCGVFFGNGVALPPKDHAGHAEWHWFPHTDGPDYAFTKPIEPLAPHRADFTILGNLSHPYGRKLLAHITGNTWLSGADIRTADNRNDGPNSVSLDQVIAGHVGHLTREPSLVMSSHGGVGVQSRATTASFDTQGRPIPAQATPRRIFERLFDQSAGRRTIAAGRRRVDFLLDDARSLRRRLGQPDQRRLDEFLASLSDVEGRLVRSEDWLGEAFPHVDPARVNLDVSPAGPAEFIRTMYDLIVLAFETDMTRVATYQISAEDSIGICDRFPAIIGLGAGHHKLSHGDIMNWAKYDRFLSEQFAYFLGRLASVKEGDARLLDNTICLYGSSTSISHVAVNYPTVVAGGGAVGLKHGRYIRQPEERPFGDLLVTLLHRLDIPVKSFADNTGEFTEIVG